MEEQTRINEINYSDIVVAIELGSRNIRGMIGRKTPAGKVEVLWSEIEPSEGVKMGVVINVEEVSFHIKSLIIRLRNVLNGMLNAGLESDSPNRVSCDIRRVYVGLHGKSIHGELNEISRKFGNNRITEMDMQSIEYENRSMAIDPKQKIVDVIPFEYVIDDENVVNTPVGCVCQNLRARFLNVHSDKLVEENLLTCFEIINQTSNSNPSNNVNCEPVLVLHSHHISDAVLSREQKEVGCMLLDFGAQTTSLSIYHENKLCYLHVFNFGSDLITQDIASMHLPMDVSEKLKRCYGSTMPGLVSPLIVTMPNGREMDTIMLAKVIESRMKDVMQRVNTAIDLSGYRAFLDSIVIIGGGSKLKHMIEMIEAETGIATRYGDIRVLDDNSQARYCDITNASVVGILMAADQGSLSVKAKEVVVKEPEKKMAKKKKINWWNGILKKGQDLANDLFSDGAVEEEEQPVEEEKHDEE
ncbi:MAG: hypothetical protein MJZ14_06105 [Paludibacteraceae bacterium]|nr:hypothetical protein [Paludibacteraceae bacterium]